MSDCLPEPPTPINMMLPLGCLSALRIFIKWRIASSKKTRFILTELLMLYSSRQLFITLSSLGTSLISSQRRTAASILRMSEKITFFSPNRSLNSRGDLNDLESMSITMSVNHFSSALLIRRSPKIREISFTHNRCILSAFQIDFQLDIRIP